MTEQTPLAPTPAPSSPTTGTAGSDWATARGESWRDHLGRMEAMLQPVDEPLIRALDLVAPCRIADVGCGGGGTTREILRRAPPGSVVNGFDISPALIEVARARSSEDHRIAFALADVGTVPPPDAPYQRLASRFGVMFFDDPAAAFASLTRWLTPGGRFAFAVWGRPADNPWHTSLREVAAQVIDVPPSRRDAPGPFRYAEPASVLALLDRAGLGDLEVREWRGELEIGGGLPAADAAQFALEAFSVGELLSKAGDAARAAVRDALTTRFSRAERDGVVRFDACVHIITGGRP